MGWNVRWQEEEEEEEETGREARWRAQKSWMDGEAAARPVRGKFEVGEIPAPHPERRGWGGGKGEARRGSREPSARKDGCPGPGPRQRTSCWSKVQRP